MPSARYYLSLEDYTVWNRRVIRGMDQEVHGSHSSHEKHWPNGSGDDKIVKIMRTKTTTIMMDKFRSEKLTWAFGSGGLKMKILVQESIHVLTACTLMYLSVCNWPICLKTLYPFTLTLVCNSYSGFVINLDKWQPNHMG